MNQIFYTNSWTWAGTELSCFSDCSWMCTNNRLARFVMGLSRKHFRIISGLLTGHVALNRHLTVMKIRTDPLCTKCGEEETAYHFLGRCSAMMMARYSIFGSYLMDITGLQQVQPYTLLRFAKASKRFI